MRGSLFQKKGRTAKFLRKFGSAWHAGDLAQQGEEICDHGWMRPETQGSLWIDGTQSAWQPSSLSLSIVPASNVQAINRWPMKTKLINTHFSPPRQSDSLWWKSYLKHTFLSWEWRQRITPYMQVLSWERNDTTTAECADTESSKNLGPATKGACPLNTVSLRFLCSCIAEQRNLWPVIKQRCIAF